MDLNGNKIGNEVLVSTNNTDKQIEPAVAATSDGGFIVSWTSEEGTDNIAMRRFNADGSEFGSNQPFTESEIMVFDVLANDFDADGDTLSITHVNGTELNGKNWVTVQDADGNALGEVRVKNNKIELRGGDEITKLFSDESADYSFEYTVDDGQGKSNSTATATVSFTVNGEGYSNTAPVAVDDSGDWIDVSDVIAITDFSGDSVIGIKHEDDKSTRQEGDLFDYTAVGSDGTSVLIYGGSDTGVYYVQRINADGSKNGAAIELKGSNTLASMDFEPSITAIGSDGDFAVTFIGEKSSGDKAVYTQKYAADGSRIGSQQSVTIESKAIGGDGASGESPVVDNTITNVSTTRNSYEHVYDTTQKVQLANGDIVEVWIGSVVKTIAGTERQVDTVMGRMFDADGTPKGDDFVINQWDQLNDTTRYNDFESVTIAESADGGFNVFWHTEYKSALVDPAADRTSDDFSTDLTIRSFSASGEPNGDEVLIEKAIKVDGGYYYEYSGKSNHTNAVNLANGNTVITWQEPNEESNQTEIKSMVLDQNLNIVHEEAALFTTINLPHTNTRDSQVYSIGNVEVVETADGNLLYTAQARKNWDTTTGADNTDYQDSEVVTWLVNPTTNEMVGEITQLTPPQDGTNWNNIDLVWDPVSENYVVLMLNQSQPNQIYKRHIDAEGNVISAPELVGTLDELNPRTLSSLRIDSIQGEMDAEGNLVVFYKYDTTWQNAPRGSDIYAAVFKSDGTKSAEKLTTQEGWGTTWGAELIQLADGNFSYTYTTSSSSTNQQRFNGIFNVDGAGNSQSAPAAGDANEVFIMSTGDSGTFTVIFTSVNGDTGKLNVYAQAYKANGKKDGGASNITPDSLKESDAQDIALTESGEHFVLSFNDGTASYVQVLNNDLTPRHDVHKLSEQTESVQNLALDNGSYLVAYQSATTVDAKIVVQRFNKDGDEVGVAVSFDTKVDGTQVSDIDSSITLLPDGGYVLAWAGAGAQNGDHDIYLKQFSADGTEIASTQLDAGNGDDVMPQVLALSSGEYAVAWIDDGIYTQKFDANGNAVGTIVHTGPMNDLAATATNVELIALSNGKFAATFESDGHLFTQTYNSDGSKALLITDSSETGTLTLGALETGDNTLSYRVNYTQGTLFIDGNEIVSGSVIDASDWENVTVEGVSLDNFDLNVSALQEYFTDEYSPISFDVLDNDSDANNDSLSISTIDGKDVSAGQTVDVTDNKGRILGSAKVVNGEIEFTPGVQIQKLSDGKIKSYSFEYTISDGQLESNAATVTFKVEGQPEPNTAPVANDDTVGLKTELQDVTSDVNLTGFTGQTSETTVLSSGNDHNFTRTIEMTQLDNGNIAVILETETNSPTEWESTYNYQYISQVYDANGNLVGSQILTPTHYAWNDDYYKIEYSADGWTTDIPDLVVTALPDGGFVHTWGTESGDIFMQRFDENGLYAGNRVQLDNPSAANNIETQVDVLFNEHTNELYVSYLSTDDLHASGSTILVQRLDSELNKVGSPHEVGTPTGNIIENSGWQPQIVTAGTEGDFYVAYQNDLGNGATSMDSYVQVQRFDKDGNEVGSRDILTGTNRDKLAGFVATDDQGSYAVAMDTASTQQSNSHVHVHAYDAESGTHVEHQLDGEGHANNFSHINGVDHVMDIQTVGDNGDFVMLWLGHDDGHGGTKDLYVQKFDSSGNKLGTQEVIGTVPYISFSTQTNLLSGGAAIEGKASITSLDADGSYIVTWTGYESTGQSLINYLRFDSDGNRIGDEVAVRNTNEVRLIEYFDLHVAADGVSGDFTLAWNTENKANVQYPGTNRGVYADEAFTQFQKMDSDGNVAPYVEGSSVGDFDIDLSGLNPSVTQIKVTFNTGTLTAGGNTYQSGDVIPQSDFDTLKISGVQPDQLELSVQALVSTNYTENDVITIDVMSNDTDADNDALTISTIDGKDVSSGQTVDVTDQNGSVLGSARVVNGEIEFTPGEQIKLLNEGEVKSYGFNYTVTDGTTESNQASVSFKVEGAAPPNEMPVLEADTYRDSGNGGLILNGTGHLKITGDFNFDMTGYTVYARVHSSALNVDTNTQGHIASVENAYQALGIYNNELQTFDRVGKDGQSFASYGEGYHDVVISWSAAWDYSVYVDGQLAFTGLHNPTTDVNNIYIGANLNGKMEAFQVIERELSASEIQNIGHDKGDHRDLIVKLDFTGATLEEAISDKSGYNHTVSMQSGSVSVEKADGEITQYDTFTIDVLANDSDADYDDLAVVKIDGKDVSNGQTVQVTQSGKIIGSARIVDGAIEFTPGAAIQALDEGEKQSFSFSYTASDGKEESSSTVSFVAEGTDPAKTPIVLDLDGDGIETLSIEEGIKFDLDADSDLDSVGWVGKDDGLLVRDVNQDGVINDASELFGNAVTLEDGNKAQDGYQALSELDSNNDGVINSDDKAFEELQVWQDANSDGVTDEGELQSLTDLGIAELSLDTRKVEIENNGNTVGIESTYTTEDGQTGEAADVWFAYDDNADTGSESSIIDSSEYENLILKEQDSLLQYLESNFDEDLEMIEGLGSEGEILDTPPSELNEEVVVNGNKDGVVLQPNSGVEPESPQNLDNLDDDIV
ncbi:MAG: Ig-like domain-containing protein [Psychrobium sp.]